MMRIRLLTAPPASPAPKHAPTDGGSLPGSPAHSGRVPAEQREVEDPHGEEAWIGETWFNLDGTDNIDAITSLTFASPRLLIVCPTRAHVPVP